jgi:hypothetical protein
MIIIDSINKNKKLIVCLVITCISISLYFEGCTIQNKEFRFTKSELKLKNDTQVRGILEGSYMSNKKESIYSAPYELLIAITPIFNSKKKSAVSIATITMLELTSKKIVFSNSEVINPEPKKDMYGIITYYWSIKDLNLIYVPYVVRLNLEIKTEDSLFDQEIELIFEKEYNEYRSNRFWDGIMSI